MQSVEMYLNDTIEKYSLFAKAATCLVREVQTLPPAKIYERCEELTLMQSELLMNKEQLFIVMEFLGPKFLDSSSICEFQRALDKSILTCNTLYNEILSYKEKITHLLQ
jgi:hypothetical protein